MPEAGQVADPPTAEQSQETVTASGVPFIIPPHVAAVDGEVVDFVKCDACGDFVLVPVDWSTRCPLCDADSPVSTIARAMVYNWYKKY